MFKIVKKLHRRFSNQMLQSLKHSDPLVYDLIQKEAQRQKKCISLIASENFVSKSILQGVGSVLMNKYSEG